VNFDERQHISAAKHAIRIRNEIMPKIWHAQVMRDLKPLTHYTTTNRQVFNNFFISDFQDLIMFKLKNLFP
jgi:hypothetical protein